MHPTEPPTGYLIHPAREGYQLDIPGVWLMPWFPALQEAVDAAWEHLASVGAAKGERA